MSWNQLVSMAETNRRELEQEKYDWVAARQREDEDRGWADLIPTEE